jgi:hypothetical protein
MRLLRDFQGLEVRLTDERLEHILEHPEMRGGETAIGVTLAYPERVIESLFDPDIRVLSVLQRNCRRGETPVCSRQDRSGRRVRPDRVHDGQHQAGVEAMARDRVKVWYDAKGDYLEVLFDQRPGYFRETTNDQVMEKVDAEGNVLGFSVLKVSGIGAKPIEVAL